jgi:hypothetical protein
MEAWIMDNNKLARFLSFLLNLLFGIGIFMLLFYIVAGSLPHYSSFKIIMPNLVIIAVGMAIVLEIIQSRLSLLWLGWKNNDATIKIKAYTQIALIYVLYGLAIVWWLSWLPELMTLYIGICALQILWSLIVTTAKLRLGSPSPISEKTKNLSETQYLIRNVLKVLAFLFVIAHILFLISMPLLMD